MHAASFTVQQATLKTDYVCKYKSMPASWPPVYCMQLHAFLLPHRQDVGISECSAAVNSEECTDWKVFQSFPGWNGMGSGCCKSQLCLVSAPATEPPLPSAFVLVLSGGILLQLARPELVSVLVDDCLQLGEHSTLGRIYFDTLTVVAVTFISVYDGQEQKLPLAVKQDCL